jgi:outer membrane immunogenic protein
MKRSVIAMLVLVVLLICGSALAAGGAGAMYDWTGFYGGLNVGGVINNSEYKLSPGSTFVVDTGRDSGHLNNGAFTVGGQLGYNYQIGRFVIGAETDFDYNSLKDSQTGSRPLPAGGANLLYTVDQKGDFVGTLRGRLGYTPLNRLLVYGTGGFAYGDVAIDSVVILQPSGNTYAGSTSKVQAGWTAGGGGEYAITKNLTIKAEYLYVDLGKRSYTYPIINSVFIAPGLDYRTSVETREHMIRFGINYKF